MSEVMTFAKEAAQRGIIVVLRLWNEGGYDSNNERLLQLAAQHQPHPWTERYDGWKLATNLYIEFDKMFEWPDEEHPEYEEEEVFCYALRNQIGVLVDGTVVPCCLDHDGAIPLGNLYQETFEEIINSPRATKLLDGFTHHCAAEPLCRKCGYAAVTKRFRK
jgi:radical SAM protein with 4Fe4S-binding SPASM domain